MSAENVLVTPLKSDYDICSSSSVCRRDVYLVLRIATGLPPYHTITFFSSGVRVERLQKLSREDDDDEW